MGLEKSELSTELAEENCFLRGAGERDDLALGNIQCDERSLGAPPRDGPIITHEDPADGAGAM
jgi:hypothetical protein